MKFILKDGLVYIVENTGLYNNSIEGTVEAPGFEHYKIEYKINNADYKVVENEKFIIPLDLLKATQIDIRFRAINKKDVVYFKSDTIPLTQAIVFGGTIEQWYPETLKDILQRLEKVEKRSVDTENKTAEQVKETEKGLKGTMKQIVETFEEINRKGSLF